MTADAGPMMPAQPSATTGEGESAIDLAFLTAQTFGDGAPRREVLGLFDAQSRRVVPSRPRLGPREQADAAHLLTGSARGIGARAAAAIASAYEAAAPAARPALYPLLDDAFARVEAAIRTEHSTGPA